MASMSRATKKNYTDIDEILALVFDENNESDGDIDLGETEFGGEEIDGDIIEHELQNIAISTPKLHQLIWYLILYQILMK